MGAETENRKKIVVTQEHSANPAKAGTLIPSHGRSTMPFTTVEVEAWGRRRCRDDTSRDRSPQEERRARWNRERRRKRVCSGSASRSGSLDPEG